MLSYFSGNGHLYIFSISQNHIDLDTISKTNFTDSEIIDFRNSFIQINGNFEGMLGQAHSYYQSLIEKPLQNHDHVNHLVIVPDGVLGYLPFELLQTELVKNQSLTYAQLPYLIKEYRTSYAYSATLYKDNASTKIINQSPYIGYAPVYQSVVNPGYAIRGENELNLTSLKGTIDEVKIAQEILGGNAFIGEKATEINFKSQSSNPAIIHLAMHALVNDHHPMQSRFLFFQGTVNQSPLPTEDRAASSTHINPAFEDSYLNVYEIYNLRLNAQLAVLSACNTGYGTIQRGEGILSLSRAFMYAGVPSIVTSLWKAKDLPTKEIMTLFYQNLKKGMDKDEALRQAKLTYLTTADQIKAHPANWATFIMVGNTAPIQIAHQGWKFAILVILLGLIVLGLLFFRRRIARNQ